MLWTKKQKVWKKPVCANVYFLYAERNYFQLEADKINSFWEITKKELQEVKAELRNKDREMEEMEERHQVEIKVLASTRCCCC